jgi:hypothetical protein
LEKVAAKGNDRLERVGAKQRKMALRRAQYAEIREID